MRVNTTKTGNEIEAVNIAASFLFLKIMNEMEERYMYFQSKEKNRWMSIFILIAFLCTTFFTPVPAFAAATPEDALRFLA